jgi:CheY-like chemotaxis protein
MRERAWTERGTSSRDSIRVGPGTGTPEGPSILLVEDDDDIRELMVTLLGMSGFHTSPCRTAEEGLEQLRESPFDLVLTDYCLPRRTGGWLLKQASAEGLLDSTPALVVTAHPGPDETDGFEVIPKPFEADALVDRVRQLTTHD